MANVTFVTGNAYKAKYFSELLEMPVNYHDANVTEIQSLDLLEIAVHKAKEAYQLLKRPVIVEDGGVAINNLGRLPSPFIKWFLEEIGTERICRLADMDEQRSAEAGDAFVYFDGKILKRFIGSLKGSISQAPLGNGGYGWDRIFIPHYSTQTLAQMDYDNYKKAHLELKPIQEIKEFMSTIG